MKVRPAEPRDRVRIEQILLACDLFSGQQRAWALELVDASLATRGEGEYRTYVLDDPASGPSRRVQAFAVYGPTPRTDDVYDLYWIAVDPEKQSNGYGRQILQFVENDVRRRGGRMLLIETSSKTTYARTVRFYEAAGYREISRIKDFYRMEHDKIVFSKSFVHP